MGNRPTINNGSNVTIAAKNAYPNYAEPNWQNDITRLNSNNMNNMKNNLIRYTDKVAEKIIAVENENLNKIINESVGEIYPNTDNTGEIFNNYEKNIASGSHSHAEGDTTEASANGSHAEGLYTKATGAASHAGGRKSEASGENSFAHGQTVKAKEANQFAVGKYNKDNAEALFIVGNGTGTAYDSKQYSNAFEVLQDGSATLSKQGETEESIVILGTLSTEVENISLVINDIDTRTTSIENAVEVIDTRINDVDSNITIIEGNISDINTKIDDVDNDINSIKNNISNALHFKGVVNFDPSKYSGTGYISGDVVIWEVQGEEYVYDGSKFVELGNANDFLLKTEAEQTYLTINQAEQTYLKINQAEGIYVPKERTIAGLNLENNISVQDLSNKLNLSNYVPVNRTIADIELTDNISKDQLLSALEVTPLGRRLTTDDKYNSNIYFDNNTIEKLYSNGSFSIGESNTIVTTRLYGMLGKGKLTWTASGEQREYIYSADSNAILFAPNGSGNFTNDIINKKIVFISNNEVIDTGVIESKVLKDDGTPVIINGSRHCYIIKDTNPDIDYSAQKWIFALLLNCEQVIGTDFPKQVNNVLMLGNNLVGNSSNSLILGKYNEYSNNFNNKLIVAGNGSDTERKTVYELDVNGNATHSGVVKAQSYQLLDGSTLNAGIVDSSLSTTSTNAVQNKVVTGKLNDIDTLIGQKPAGYNYESLWSTLHNSITDLSQLTTDVENKMGYIGDIFDLNGEKINFIPSDVGDDEVTINLRGNFTRFTNHFTYPSEAGYDILSGSSDPGTVASVGTVRVMFDAYNEHFLPHIISTNLDEYITFGTGEPNSSTPGKIYIQIYN